MTKQRESRRSRASATPSGMPAALQRVETDIASVLLARLEGLFTREALDLDVEMPRTGGFLSRLGTAEFWACALCRKDQPRWTAAARFYLQTLFPGHSAMRFGDDCRMWGRSFYATRHDPEGARDILLLYLAQNLHRLKRLYILEQPHNRNLAPETRALERCFGAPANAMLFVGDRFSRWVLEEWLPYQLRFVCCRQFLAGDPAPAAECRQHAPGGVPVMLN